MARSNRHWMTSLRAVALCAALARVAGQVVTPLDTGVNGEVFAIASDNVQYV